MGSFRDRARVVTNSVVELLCKKRADYGTANIKDEKQILSRVQDKVSRLDTLLSSGRTPDVEETLEDTWSDIIGYAVIALLLRKNQWHLEDTLSETASPEFSKPAKPRRPRVKSVYLAGPMDDVDKAHISAGWRDTAVNLFTRAGVATFRPDTCITLPHTDVSMSLIATQVAALECDAMLAYLPSGVAAIGTVAEIVMAMQNGKRVFVVCNYESAYIKHWVERGLLTAYKDVNEAIKSILE